MAFNTPDSSDTDDRAELEAEIALDDETIEWDADRHYEIGDSTDDEDD